MMEIFPDHLLFMKRQLSELLCEISISIAGCIDLFCNCFSTHHFG